MSTINGGIQLAQSRIVQPSFGASASLVPQGQNQGDIFGSKTIDSQHRSNELFTIAALLAGGKFVLTALGLTWIYEQFFTKGDAEKAAEANPQQENEKSGFLSSWFGPESMVGKYLIEPVKNLFKDNAIGKFINEWIIEPFFGGDSKAASTKPAEPAASQPTTEPAKTEPAAAPEKDAEVKPAEVTSETTAPAVAEVPPQAEPVAAAEPPAAEAPPATTEGTPAEPPAASEGQ